MEVDHAMVDRVATTNGVVGTHHRLRPSANILHLAFSMPLFALLNNADEPDLVVSDEASSSSESVFNLILIDCKLTPSPSFSPV